MNNIATGAPLACVIGWPVKHSRSPVIHRFWLNELGLAGDYVLHPVEPENATAFFANFATSGFVGGMGTEAGTTEAGVEEVVELDGVESPRPAMTPAPPRMSRAPDSLWKAFASRVLIADTVRTRPRLSGVNGFRCSCSWPDESSRTFRADSR